MFNKTNGALSHLNVEREDVEDQISIERQHKSEGFLREDNFKSLSQVRRSRIFIENLITGKFSRINHELAEDEVDVETADPRAHVTPIEEELHFEMQRWHWRIETY